MVIFYATSVAQQMLHERSLMPPKVKFSKEVIIGTALQLVREQGMSSLTARALAVSYTHLTLPTNSRV